VYHANQGFDVRGTLASEYNHFFQITAIMNVQEREPNR